MAGQKLETTISMTDKFSKTVADFEKKLYHTLKPINSLEKSFKRLGDAFALKELGKSFNMLKNSSTEFFFNIRNIGQSFGYIKDAFVGVVNLLDKVTAKGDQLAKTSERLGFTVEELQKFEYVADLAGVSSENFTKGMKKLSEASVEAAGGTKTQVEAFKALGISVKNADGSIKSSQELLFALSDRFAETGKRELSASQKIYAAQKLLGKSGVDMITVLNQGSAAIKTQMDELVSLGIIDEEQAKQSAEYRDEVGKLKRAIDNLSISVASDLFGPMTESVKYLTDYLKNNKDTLVKAIQPFINKIPEMAQTFTDVLPDILDAFTKIAAGAKWLVDFVGIKFPVLVAVFSGVIIPLTVMIVSFVRSIKAVISTITRMVYFVGTRFPGAAKKATVATDEVSRKMNKTGTAVQRTESRLHRLFAALRRTASGFDRMGKSAQTAGTKVNATGSKALKTAGKLGAAIMALNAAADAFANVTSHENKDKTTGQKASMFMEDFMSGIPVIGGLWKGLYNLVTEDVQFEPSEGPDLAALMANVEDSDLFNLAAQKPSEKYTHSTIDVNFNNVPPNTTIKRTGFNDPAMYGFSMTPTF